MAAKRISAPERDPLAILVSDAPGLCLICYDAEGRILRYDEGAEKIFGHRAAKVLGQLASESLHRPADVARIVAPTTETRELLLPGYTVGGEAIPTRVIVRDGGEDHPLRFHALYQDLTPLHDVARKFEEFREQVNQNKRQSEREAEFLREVLRHTMETIQIGLLMIEVESGMIAHANDGFARLTGLSAGDAIAGYTLPMVLEKHPETINQLEGYLEKIKAYMQGKTELPAPGNWDLSFPAGKRTVEVYGQPVVVEGHTSTYILLIIEDHTERQRLQLQLAQSEKLAAIGQLAAGIAHEIRNPLGTIYNALFDLGEIIKNPTPEVAEDIDIAMEEIKRVQEIINNLLDFARESERSIGRANLNEVVQKTLRLVQHDLTNRSIITNWEPGEVPEVSISSNALKQILINLITNAAQAMASGGTLRLRTVRRTGRVPERPMGTPITLDAETGLLSLEGLTRGPDRARKTGHHTEHVLLEVSDTGPGISKDILANIFNPFFTTKAPGSGTGLGLSVVHSLVQDSGGALGVQTIEGKGTTFIIELPAIHIEE